MDIWPDELYILQKANPNIIYSGETALYIHELTDREYNRIEITVPRGYNATHLRKRNIKVRTSGNGAYSDFSDGDQRIISYGDNEIAEDESSEKLITVLHLT